MTYSVLNARRTAREGQDRVYIGRPSKWGNPFEIGRDGTREEVIELYSEWIVHRPELLAALPELYDKHLVCWCSPLPCHGNVLLKLIGTKEASVNAVEEAAAIILQEAAGSEFGLIIKVRTTINSDIMTPTIRGRQLLYRIRRELGDPALKDIQVRLSPTKPDEELWLIKGATKNSPEMVHNSMELTVDDIEI